MSQSNIFDGRELVDNIYHLVSQPAVRRKFGVMRPGNGFTIVELLIVIVIIGILAAIVVVSYTGITTRANNTAKISELKTIEQLFEAYKATTGTYPRQDLATSTAPTSNPYGTNYPVGYCVGAGYPNAGTPSQPSCYLMTTSASLPYTYRENDATAVDIKNELATVGKVPASIVDLRVNNVMGPVAFYYTDRIYIVTVIKAETINDCPDGTERHYPGDQATLVSQNYRLECRVRLMK